MLKTWLYSLRLPWRKSSEPFLNRVHCFTAIVISLLLFRCPFLSSAASVSSASTGTMLTADKFQGITSIILHNIPEAIPWNLLNVFIRICSCIILLLNKCFALLSYQVSVSAVLTVVWISVAWISVVLISVVWISVVWISMFMHLWFSFICVLTPNIYRPLTKDIWLYSYCTLKCTLNQRSFYGFLWADWCLP